MDNTFKHSSEYIKYLNSLPKEVYIKILENIFSAILVNDKDGNTIYANPAVTKHYGKTPEELVSLRNWGIWQGVVSPPAYKEMLEVKRTLFYKQMHFNSQEALTTIVNPVFNEDHELEMMVSLLQENIESFDKVYEEESELSDKQESPFKNIIGESQNYLKELVLLRRAAKSKTPILILGESGVGKSLTAKFIHDSSDRKNQPFWDINCAAIPENLLESELFGYVPHAFTGAGAKGKKGLIQLADHGTLFLDEIGDLPLSLQAKLLYVIESGKFLPIGAENYVEADVRILTATNQNLEQLIQERKFREDLYWRINAITSRIPSLRERRDDIIPLAFYFLKLNNQNNTIQKKFSSQIFPLLLKYHWPGNIRELKNVIDRCYILSPGYTIQPDKLPSTIYTEEDRSNNTDSFDFDLMIEAYERQIIREIYRIEKTIVGVQKKLKISQNKAFRLVKKYCEDLTEK
ncbi:sigma 54-interacting transcriptional regulator [Eubacterium sp. 1001713B170207_170306_E7]|uniref:sigma-54 interaction domain-containing protein n=1 Tax=Eubacterium sp. 1001713B170207_170306_E7 TaxID=2787097 RepID=UPI0018985712|nr:sigma 54-interacting transcriptional regulator [Eubacterium sp. 1001713B170207_170306_E7]